LDNDVVKYALFYMKNFYLSFFLFFFISSFAQNSTTDTSVDNIMNDIPRDFCTSTDKVSNYIRMHFQSDSDKIRAAFYWTATTLNYDVANMFNQNLNATSQEKTENALKYRMGVCMHYAAIFNKIVNSLGIQSYEVIGYTKQNNKESTISHAWCVAKIGANWYAFDPTWGGGSVNNGRFYKELNNNWYKVPPAKMIESHMPFDYLWQLLENPVSDFKFKKRKKSNTDTNKKFDFEAELQNYLSLSEAEQAKASLKRIEKNGINNALIETQYTYLKNLAIYFDQKSNIEKLNAIVVQYNISVNQFNDFVNYRNKQFQPAIPDYQIKEMIENPRVQMEKCQELLSILGDTGLQNVAIINSLKSNIDKTLIQVRKHLEFVNLYLSKSKNSRKTMFLNNTF
jgi:hypothetical protein